MQSVDPAQRQPVNQGKAQLASQSASQPALQPALRPTNICEQTALPSPTLPESEVSESIASEAQTDSAQLDPDQTDSDQAHSGQSSSSQRIRQLELALDQALTYIDELRYQVQNQHLLEVQLAHTEDYASVQQQAILRLKHQLAEQQQELEAQILETQQRDQAIQELLARIETMTQAQQREVERLRSRLAQDQRQVQHHRSQLGKHLQDLQTGLESRQRRIAELEAETLAARLLSTRLQSQLEGAQQQIKELSARLSHYQLHLSQLEAQLEQSQSGAVQNHSVSGPLESEQGNRAHSPEPIPAFVPSAQRHWQQEIGAERDWLLDRVSGLEQQVAELQEQVLRQAQQETEYETAVQYWKDRYRVGQAQASHLKDLAQRVSPELPPTQELLLAVQALPSEDQFEQTDAIPAEQPLALEASSSSGSTDELPLVPRLATVELPEFLVRRRAAESCAAPGS